MKTKTLILLLLALALCLSLVACGDKKVTAIEITEGLPRSCEIGTVYDFSTVKAKITYNDDSVVEVTGADLTFGELNTGTIGTKALTITYEGFTITVDIKVYGAANGGVVGGGSTEGGTEGGNEGGNETVSNIYGVEMPDNLVAYTQNANRFTVKDDTYVVGDANPFTFTLKLNILDDDDNWVTTATRYESLSKVYLVTTEGETVVGNEYVTVNEEDNTFDFTETAVGKIFRIETRPANVAAGSEQDCTRSLTVRVVSGYNVTDVKELNLITNDDDELHEQYEGELLQNAIAAAFVDQHFGAGYYSTYGGNSIKGLVLHCDLAPTTADIPAEYITNNADGSLGFDDNFTVYNRSITLASGGFSVYGNYFTINTSSLPLMSNDPAIVDTRVSSNSDVFGFSDSRETRQTLEGLQSFDYTKFPCLVENLSLRDDNPNSNNETENERHMRGLNAFNFMLVDATVDNSIIEAYTISVVVEESNTKLTLEDCIFNNAWQNHIFAWTVNNLQSRAGDEYEEMAPWSSLTPIEVEIHNSSLTKCGGPVILQMRANNRPYNATAGLYVTVDATSQLYSYVTGSEAWFTAYAAMGATTYANKIKAIGVAIANTANANGKSASILTTMEGTGETQFMNLVFCSLSGNAKYVVNGTTVMDNNDAVVAAHNAGLGTYGAPLLQSTVNNTATATNLEGQMGTPADQVFNPNVATGGNGVIDPDFFEGDLLNFHVGEIAVVMGYFHPEA